MAGKLEAFDPYLHWLGIDLASRPIHHYTLLGLPPFEADPNRISAAADERMRHVRQFQAGPRGMYTQRLLNELATARICLLSPASKAVYDQQLHQYLYPPTVPTNAEPPKPKRRVQELMPPVWDGFAGVTDLEAHTPSSDVSAQAADEAASEVAPKSKASQRDLQMVAILGVLILLVAVLGGVFIWRLSRPEPQVAKNTTTAELSPEVDESPQPEPADPKTPSTKKTTAKPMPKPVVEKPSEAIVVLQEGSGELNLTPATALVEGDLEREVIGTNDALVKWSGPDDAAEWQFKLVKPGFFELELQYISHPSLAGKLVKVGWGSETKTIRLRAPEGEAGTIRDSHIIVIKKGGVHTLIVRPAEAWPENTLQLLSVRLIPATGP